MARFTIAYFRNADCSSFNSTTWAATIVGTAANPIRRLLIESTCDQDLEFGYETGTGNTAAFGWLGVPHSIVLDLEPGFLAETLLVRRQGTTPTANTKLIISALG